MFCDGGVSVSDGTGIEIEPLTSESCPLPDVSFVAGDPPSSVSCVVLLSSVRVMVVPGVADPERLKTRWATWLPGADASSVNGIGLLDCWKLARREIEPELEGEVSKAGLSDDVMPARVNVTDDTADAGE